MKRFFEIFLYLLLGISLFFAALVYTIPDEFISSLIKGKLKSSTGIVFIENSARKIFPFGMEFKEASFFNETSKIPLLNLDKMHIKLNPIYIFIGKIYIAVNGIKGDAKLDANFSFGRKGDEADIVINGLDVNITPYNLSSINNLYGKADIKFHGSNCPSGDLYLEGDIGSFMLQGIRFSPGKKTRASISGKLKECRMNINGLWLENDDMKINLKGELLFKSPYIKSQLNLAAEVMSRKSFNGKDDYLFLLIKKYQKSKNYYLIKIEGTIEMPVLS